MTTPESPYALAPHRVISNVLRHNAECLNQSGLNQTIPDMTIFEKKQKKDNNQVFQTHQIYNRNE